LQKDGGKLRKVIIKNKVFNEDIGLLFRLIVFVREESLHGISLN